MARIALTAVGLGVLTASAFVLGKSCGVVPMPSSPPPKAIEAPAFIGRRATAAVPPPALKAAVLPTIVPDAPVATPSPLGLAPLADFTPRRSEMMLGVMVGPGAVGGLVQGRVVGPLWLGGYVMSDKSYGVTLSAEF